MEFRKKQKMLFYDERKAAIKGKLNESNSLKIKIKEKSLVDLQIDVLKTALNKAEKKLNDSVVDAKLTMQREYDNGIKRQINTRNIIKNILKEKFNPFEEEDYEVYDTFDPDLYKSAFIGFIDLEECNPSSKWKILNLIGYSRTKHGKEVTVEIKGNFSHTQFNYDSDERMYMLLRSHNKETLEKAIKDYIKKIHELS